MGLKGAGQSSGGTSQSSGAASAIKSVGSSFNPLSSIISGGASIINGLVNNIFSANTKKKELDLKAQEQYFKESLSALSNEQTYVLQMQLNNATTETERLKILEGAITSIKIAQLNKTDYTTPILIVGGLTALVLIIFITKDK